jgi:hypothetical protein
VSNAKTWRAVENQPDKSKEKIAPAGTIFVCAACGKTSRDVTRGPAGWDVSCMQHAVLCHDEGASSEN